MNTFKTELLSQACFAVSRTLNSFQHKHFLRSQMILGEDWRIIFQSGWLSNQLTIFGRYNMFQALHGVSEQDFLTFLGSRRKRLESFWENQERTNLDTTCLAAWMIQKKTCVTDRWPLFIFFCRMNCFPSQWFFHTCLNCSWEVVLFVSGTLF